MTPSGPGDMRPSPPADPGNPLDVPKSLSPVRVDIDWARRIVRIEQQATPFDIRPQRLFVPLFALKALCAHMISLEAKAEGDQLQAPGAPPAPMDLSRPGGNGAPPA